MPEIDQYANHYMAIGRMLVAFQSLEATLKDNLCMLLNNKLGTPGGHLAYATMAELSFGTASRLASAVPDAFSAERIDAKDEAGKARLRASLVDVEGRLREGLKIANQVEQRRNQLVHSRWFISPGYVPEPGKMARMKTKTKAGSITHVFESESQADLDANTEKAKEAQALIGSALREYLFIGQHSW